MNGLAQVVSLIGLALFVYWLRQKPARAIAVVAEPIPAWPEIPEPRPLDSNEQVWLMLKNLAKSNLVDAAERARIIGYLEGRNAL